MDLTVYMVENLYYFCSRQPFIEITKLQPYIFMNMDYMNNIFSSLGGTQYGSNIHKSNKPTFS